MRLLGRHAAGEQLLDRLDHAAVLLAGGVEEHLQGQLARLGARELRRPGLLRALGGLRSHFAVLAMVTSLGLNWKSMRAALGPGALPPVAGVGSYSFSAAFSILRRGRCRPAGDGG